MKITELVKKYIPIPALVPFVTLFLSGIMYLVSIYVRPVADFLNSTVGVAVRWLLSVLTGWLPFSLFELLVILALPLVLLFVVLTVRRARDRVARVRNLFALLALISIILVSYIFTLGIAYRTTPVAEQIGIEDARDVTPTELYSVATLIRDEANSLAEGLTYKNGESVMDYTLGEASERLSDAYRTLSKEYTAIITFNSRVKPVLASTVMSDAGITGIYGFLTGEANVNIEYPHHEIVFSAAHEMAHQRGIARENEANFIAFLVCISSDDDFVRYSGYISMLRYFMNAVYATDKELYKELVAGTDERVISDIRASNAVTIRHRDSLLGKINDKLNDRYLKFNGTEGVVTYGYAVRLAVGYYRTHS